MKHNQKCGCQHGRGYPESNKGDGRKYMHLADKQRYVFPAIPTHLDHETRVDNWYMDTLEALGIWPGYPSGGDYLNYPKKECHIHNRRRPGYGPTCCYHCDHVDTNKPERHYLFFCINNRCKVDGFMVKESKLELVAINPYTQERIYTTKCKCGLLCASKQIVDPKNCESNENCHHPIYHEPRNRRNHKNNPNEKYVCPTCRASDEEDMELIKAACNCECSECCGEPDEG